jgi:hypothetical protein
MNTSAITKHIDRNKFEVEFPEDGPVFGFRYLSVAKFQKAATLFDSRTEARDGAIAIAKMMGVLTMGLKSWRNVKTDDPEVCELFGVKQASPDALVELPYDPQHLDAVLRLPEMSALVEEFMQAQNPTPAALGNSPSPVSSQQVNSAKTASPDEDAAIFTMG